MLVAATGRLGSASVIVRRATPADIPEIVRLKALLMETGWPWPVAVSEDEDWRRRCAEAADVLLSRDTYACFVVDVGAHVREVCRQAPPAGTGQVLLHRHADAPGEQGAGRIELHSTESGRRVYERAGFEADGPFRHLGRQLV